MYIDSKEFEGYAQLLLHLTDVSEGDLVFLNANFESHPLVEYVIQHAYKRGAKYVELSIGSSKLDGLRAKYSKEKFLEYFPHSRIEVFKEYDAKKACVISIRSPEDPAVNQGVPASALKTLDSIKRDKLKFFHKSIVSDQLSWIVSAFPTTGWAKTVFPKLDPAQGVKKLWEELKVILRLDTPDPIKAWETQQKKILARRAYLNKKKYTGIHLIDKQDTDVFVALHERSNWIGAAHTSANGKYFQANVPTEEVYTSPDCRFSKGWVTVQRALPIFGKQVSGITMTFEDGKVVKAHAEVNDDMLQQYLNADPRNRYMGELALVDTESLIWKSGLLFNNILYDENAGVHFALGTAYTNGYGFSSSDDTSDEKMLLDMGCNVSQFHLDFTIGSDTMDVYGVCADGTEDPIIQQGRFIEALRTPT